MARGNYLVEGISVKYTKSFKNYKSAIKAAYRYAYYSMQLVKVFSDGKVIFSVTFDEAFDALNA